MQRLTSRFQRPSATHPDLPKAAKAVPRTPSLRFTSAPTSEDKAASRERPARHGCAGVRLRQRNGYPPRLRPTTWRRRSFRGKGLRRTTPSTGLTCQASRPTVRRQWPLGRQMTLPLYLAGPLGPGWLFRRTANGRFGSGGRSAVTLARAGSMFRFLAPSRQLEKPSLDQFSVHKFRLWTQFLHRFSTKAYQPPTRQT